MKQHNQFLHFNKCILKGVTSKSALFTFCAVLACLPHLQCFAEGTNARGGHGVNRRVETDEGYTKVWGTFTIEEITPPSNSAYSNNQTKPTLYFAARNGTANESVNSEGGLQYERSRPSSPAPGAPVIPDGFVIFLRWSHSDLNNNPDNSDGWIQAYRPQTGTENFIPIVVSSVNNMTMTYQIQGGGEASLDVDGVGKFYSQPLSPWKWTPRPTTIYPADPAMAERIYPVSSGVVIGTSIRMRRVIGITQKTGLHGEIDGTTMTTKFSDGRVAAFDAAHPNDPVNKNWLPERVDQANTGYDVADRLRGVAPEGGPAFVVEFPEIDALPGYASTNTSAKARAVARSDANKLSYKLKEEDITRYENETVRITLKANPAGRGRVRPGRRRH